MEDQIPPLSKNQVMTESQKETWKTVTSWIYLEIQKGFIPRKLDVLDYMKKNKLKISGGASKVGFLLRQLPEYHSTSHQQRRPLRTFKNRPILVNNLGHLHADIGYFSIRKDYATPKTFQFGFLVAKDILSRYTYFVLMKGQKSGNNMKRVLGRLIKKHESVHNYPIFSIAFDQEPAMLSKTVQDFLKENNISLRIFYMSRNKSMMAESAIKQLRIDYERYRIQTGEKWWTNLETKLQNNFNSKEIYLKGKKTGFTPNNISPENVDQFLDKLHEIMPSTKFGHSNINEKFVSFKFLVGDIVQPTVVATSSKVLGEKTSQLSIRPDQYVILKRRAVLHQDNYIRPGYLCQNLQNTNKIDLFDEQDLVLALVN